MCDRWNLFVGITYKVEQNSAACSKVENTCKHQPLGLCSLNSCNRYARTRAHTAHRIGQAHACTHARTRTRPHACMHARTHACARVLAPCTLACVRAPTCAYTSNGVGFCCHHRFPHISRCCRCVDCIIPGNTPLYSWGRKLVTPHIFLVAETDIIALTIRCVRALSSTRSRPSSNAARGFAEASKRVFIVRHNAKYVTGKITSICLLNTSTWVCVSLVVSQPTTPPPSPPPPAPQNYCSHAHPRPKSRGCGWIRDPGLVQPLSSVDQRFLSGCLSAIAV